MVGKVALIWVNYNSSHIINVVKKSLESLFNLDYPRNKLEIVVIDNASTDNSWKVVKGLSRKLAERTGIKSIFYRALRNLMYTGGNDLGLKLISRDVDFVGFINNDVIIDPLSVSQLVEYLSTYRFVGAVQGILYYDLRKYYVNSAGLFMDTLFNCHMVSTKISKPISVTYTHGAYSIYSINAIRDSLHNGRLFFQCVPAFFDDNYLGIRLWNLGYMSCALPIDAGTHLHSGTFKKFNLLREINSFKSLVVKEFVINRDLPLLHKLYFIKKIVISSRVLGYKLTFKTYKEGLTCSKYILKYLGSKLNIEKIPHIRLKTSEILRVVFGAGRSVYGKFMNGDYVLNRACLKNLCPK